MPTDTCSECGNKIQTMCFKGTGVCCENCRKVRDGEVAVVRATVHAAEPVIRINSKKVL